MTYPLFLGPAIDPAAKNLRLGAAWIAVRFPHCRLPPDGICLDLEAFIEGLNALVVRQLRGAVAGRVRPSSAADHIRVDGSIPSHLEILCFGRWVVNGKPGLAPVPGSNPDDIAVLRTVAAAAAELHDADRKRTWRGMSTKPSAHTSERLTRTHLSKRWTIMFGEATAPSDFRRRIATAFRYLEAYLADLATTKIISGTSKRRVRSPHLERTLKALRSGSGRA